MAISYGMDYSVFTGTVKDIDLTFSPVTDYIQVIFEEVYKRLTTQEGIESPPAGQFWDTATMDIKNYFLKAMSNKELSILKNRIETMFDAEPRFKVVASPVRDPLGNLTVTLNIYPSTSTTPIVMVFSQNSPEVSFARSHS